MAIVADTARFHADDCEALVLASLACPLCLRSDTVSWELLADGYDASVQCSCRRCEERWCVYLTTWQAVRLGLIAARRP